MCAILLGVLLCLGYTQAVDIARCSQGNDTKTTLTPYNDTDLVLGRYLAEWCINVDRSAFVPTDWELQLTFFHSNIYCENPPKDEVFSQGTMHSSYKQSIEFNDDCSHVCLNMKLDLIFSSCYLLKTNFLIHTLRRNITDKFIYINNSYTQEYFEESTALVNLIHHDSENVTIKWHTGVSFLSYVSVLWRKSNTSQEFEQIECTAPSDLLVQCDARLPPGKYHTQLDINAPWKKGVFGDQGIFTYEFTVKPPTIPTVELAPVWPWALAALITAVILGIAMCWGCGWWDKRKQTKNIIKRLLTNERSEPITMPAVVRPPQRHILMLYAREGPYAAKFTAALRDILQEAPDTQVYDLFTPEVTAMAASGPNSWVRAMLQRSDVSVLLLQTPALAALYQQRLHANDNSVRLQEPLLGQRFLYRNPCCGDMLLQYATHLIHESPQERNNYFKYHLAGLPELPAEVFPHLVPYDRYMLPAAAVLLVKKLCDGYVPSEQSVESLAMAAREFVDHAKRNPGYILEELIEL